MLVQRSELNSGWRTALDKNYLLLLLLLLCLQVAGMWSQAAAKAWDSDFQPEAGGSHRLSSAGAATSIVFVATNTWVLQRNIFCCDKNMLARKKLLSRQTRLSWQNFGRYKTDTCCSSCQRLETRTSSRRRTCWRRPGWVWFPCSDGFLCRRTCACSNHLCPSAWTVCSRAQHTQVIIDRYTDSWTQMGEQWQENRQVGHTGEHM